MVANPDAMNAATPRGVRISVGFARWSPSLSRSLRDCRRAGDVTNGVDAATGRVVVVCISRSDVNAGAATSHELVGGFGLGDLRSRLQRRVRPAGEQSDGACGKGDAE